MSQCRGSGVFDEFDEKRVVILISEKTWSAYYRYSSEANAATLDLRSYYGFWSDHDETSESLMMSQRGHIRVSTSFTLCSPTNPVL
jgi:hypothetical protein